MIQTKRITILLIISSSLLPFLCSSILIYFPDFFAPIFKLFIGEVNNIEKADFVNFYGIVIFFGLSIAPGLSCLLCLKNSPTRRILWAIIYAFVMSLLVYVYILVLGLKRSGYI